MAEKHIPPHVYVARLTVAQLTMISEALRAYAENRVIDLNEIENTDHREIIRQALDLRKVALRDLIKTIDKVTIDEVKLPPSSTITEEGR